MVETQSKITQTMSVGPGADLGGGRRGCAPPLRWPFGVLIQLVFCQKKKKTMWFIGVEVEQETSAPPPKKNPGSAPGDCCICTTMQIEWNGYEVCQTSLLLYLWTWWCATFNSIPIILVLSQLVNKLSRAFWRWGGKRKESLQLLTGLWNLPICIEKVDVKCWLDDIGNDVITLGKWFSMFVYIRAHFHFAFIFTSRWLAEIWQLSRRGATGELEVEFKFQRHSCKFSFLFLPHCQSALESLLPR